MNENYLFLILWFVSCVLVAAIMEVIKKKSKFNGKKLWWLIAFLLTVLLTLSTWFGVEGHEGNVYLLPLFIIGGYYIQLTLDMLVVKKIGKALIKWYLKKKDIKVE
jgi:Na+/melibiose symporter-like transporter